MRPAEFFSWKFVIRKACPSVPPPGFQKKIPFTQRLSQTRATFSKTISLSLCLRFAYRTGCLVEGAKQHEILNNLWCELRQYVEILSGWPPSSLCISDGFCSTKPEIFSGCKFLARGQVLRQSAANVEWQAVTAKNPSHVWEVIWPRNLRMIRVELKVNSTNSRGPSGMPHLS